MRSACRKAIPPGARPTLVLDQTIPEAALADSAGPRNLPHGGRSVSLLWNRGGTTLHSSASLKRTIPPAVGLFFVPNFFLTGRLDEGMNWESNER